MGGLLQLYALSDLHVNHRKNRETLEALPAHPDDWLILGGDLGERRSQLEWVLDLLGPKWAQILWVPGNHELYTLRSEENGLRGEARYVDLVEACRERGVLTPEDPYVPWPADPELVLCPLFLLYDYSMAPEGLDPAGAVAWAREDGILCTDESLLHPDPHPSRQAWCAHRLALTQTRLEALGGKRTVLINHWPLRLDLVRLFAIPRFTPWCGTRKTEDWHRRFNAEVVVSGHLHMRATDWRDGVRFEEVSLGYPRHWQERTGAEGYIRRILPGPPAPASDAGPFWHR